MVQLRNLAAQPAPAEATQGNTARFIAAANSRPVTKKSLPTNFRLTPQIIAILDEQATRSGQNKTTDPQCGHSRLPQHERERA